MNWIDYYEKKEEKWDFLDWFIFIVGLIDSALFGFILGILGSVLIW